MIKPFFYARVFGELLFAWNVLFARLAAVPFVEATAIL